jgi:hypothetical protein
MMALAGYTSRMYTDPTTIKSLYTPNLNCIRDPENAQLLENFIHNLFMVKAQHFTRRGSLHLATEFYLATILMYHEELKAEFSVQHIIVGKTERVAHDLGITSTTLRIWGSIIKDDVKLNNSRVAGDSIDHELLMENHILS